MVGYYMRRFTWLMYCTYRDTNHWAFDFIAWFQRSNFITLFIRGVKHFLLSHNIWHHAVLNSAVSSRLKSITDQHHLPEEQPWAAQIKREDNKRKSVLKYNNIDFERVRVTHRDPVIQISHCTGQFHCITQGHSGRFCKVMKYFACPGSSTTQCIANSCQSRNVLWVKANVWFTWWVVKVKETKCGWGINKTIVMLPCRELLHPGPSVSCYINYYYYYFMFLFWLFFLTIKPLAY